MTCFVDNVTFEVIHCAACAMAFAVPQRFERDRRNDHRTFYCPAGHDNVFRGKTEAQILREKLASTEDLLGRVEAERARVRHERDAIAKAHRKMRVRVANGVCPCCNRSFENLRAHMATQHADFGAEQTLRALREAFGMTQAQVAEEAGTRAPYVSNYERGKPVPVEAREALDWWRERQAG